MSDVRGHRSLALSATQPFVWRLFLRGFRAVLFAWQQQHQRRGASKALKGGFKG